MKNKKIYLINKHTRTIRRFTEEEEQFYKHLLKTEKMTYVKFDKWPTEKQYFEVTGEW